MSRRKVKENAPFPNWILSHAVSMSAVMTLLLLLSIRYLRDLETINQIEEMSKKSLHVVDLAAT